MWNAWLLWVSWHQGLAVNKRDLRTWCTAGKDGAENAASPDFRCLWTLRAAPSLLREGDLRSTVEMSRNSRRRVPCDIFPPLRSYITLIFDSNLYTRSIISPGREILTTMNWLIGKYVLADAQKQIEMNIENSALDKCISLGKQGYIYLEAHSSDIKYNILCDHLDMVWMCSQEEYLKLEWSSSGLE